MKKLFTQRLFAYMLAAVIVTITAILCYRQLSHRGATRRRVERGLSIRP